MSDKNIEIIKDGEEAIGSMTTKVFEIDIENEKFHFWRSTYTWDQLLEIAKWIKEQRELNLVKEEVPF
jgi:hypothetical protein|tara:strand:- start:506 stop:709 length:204 start_codon:yes stop_codon:yes gene_type:complete